MGSASMMSRRLLQLDAPYKALVMSLANFLRQGQYNRAMMLDAVLLADEIYQEEQIDRRIREPISQVWPTQNLT